MSSPLKDQEGLHEKNNNKREKDQELVISSSYFLIDFIIR